MEETGGMVKMGWAQSYGNKGEHGWREKMGVTKGSDGVGIW